MPKLSVYQAINKSFLLWGIKPVELRVYYKWELKKRKRPIQIPCIIVDYSRNNREWIIIYKTQQKVFSCTIDDITGTGSIQLFDNVD